MLMHGSQRTRRARRAAQAALAVVFALGVVLGPAGALAVSPATMYSPLVPERVSISSSGVQGDNWSNTPAISDDGRFVAFESRATNLADGDSNGNRTDIYLRDRLSPEPTLVTSLRGRRGRDRPRVPESDHQR